MYDKGIEAFIEVTTVGTISAAAKRLYITQPAVTHRLKELELQLGFVLLDRQRGAKSVRLTQAGEVFYPLAEKWRDLWQETKKMQSTISKTSVRIGCIDSISTFLLPDFYRELSNGTPQIHLQIHTMRSEQLYEKISNREIDVAFTLQNQHLKNLNVSIFYEEPLCVVCSSVNQNLSSEVDLTQLNPKNELYINWSPSYQTWHNQQWSGGYDSRIELDSVSLALKLIKETENWAILPQSAATSIQKNEGFMILQPIQSTPKRVTYMVTHEYPRNSAKQGIKTLQGLAAQFKF